MKFLKLIILFALLEVSASADNVRNYIINPFTGQVDTNRLIISRYAPPEVGSSGVVGVEYLKSTPRSPWTNFLDIGWYSVSNPVIRSAYILRIDSNSTNLYDATQRLHSVVGSPTIYDSVRKIQTNGVSISESNFNTINFIGGDNVTVTGAVVSGVAKIGISSSGSGGGGGSATNVYFISGQNTTAARIGGSNTFHVTGLLTNSTLGNAATATDAAFATEATRASGLLDLDSVDALTTTLTRIVATSGHEFWGNGAGLTNIPQAGIPSLSSDLSSKAGTNAPTLYNPTFNGTETNASLTGGVLAADANGKKKIAALSGLTWDGNTLTASGGGFTAGLLAETNSISRVLVSDTTPQDPYRWINATNGLIRFPAWASDRIVGSLTPGIHFLSVTNGADHFSIDVQHDHAAAGKSEARIIGLWDMAIVPGYNSGIQLGASTDNYNQEVHVQYANRMGWSHLFNLRGNTNGNIGSISLQGRRISASTNLNELWIWANEPTWNTYPTPGFSVTPPQIAKFGIDGSYFYSGLHGPLVWATNRMQAGLGTRFGSTDGGFEATGGYSDSIILGGDFAAATRTDGANKYGWISSVAKTFSNARLAMLNWVVDGASTATLNIGGGSSVQAPFNRVQIFARSDSTQASGTNLCASFTPGQVWITTNLVVGGLASATNGFLVKSNAIVSPPTLAEGDNWYFSSNGIPHVRYRFGGVTTSGSLAWGGTNVGGVAWGAISGTLSSQTDLQTALDAKAALAEANQFTKTNAFDALRVTNLLQGASTAIIGWNAANKLLTTQSVSVAGSQITLSGTDGKLLYNNAGGIDYAEWANVQALTSNAILTNNHSADVTFAGKITGNGSGITNLQFAPTAITLNGTNAAMLSNTVSTLIVSTNVLFTNWPAMAVAGYWGRTILTNSQPNNELIYVPTNMMTHNLTNSVGCYVVLDNTGTNWACTLTNLRTAELVWSAWGGNVNSMHAYFRHW